MEKAIEQLELLIAKGKEFTYENFSEKSRNGYPISFGPDWVAWQTRVKSIIVKLFGKDSAHNKAMETALAVQVIGNGPDKFEQCKNYIIGTLQTSIDTLKNDVFNELKTESTEAPGSLSNKVFVVHGHDDAAKSALEIFLRELGLEPIVLHRQADQGQTIIEKFEKHADVGYAFILLTPDEVSYLKKDESVDDKARKKELRARQNVIFEFGYFVGRLGRSRVCCLHTGNVVLPTDLSGMVYKSYSSSVEEAAYGIIKDLKASGYKLA
jgi:predicted nucleotide-binding protein